MEPVAAVPRLRLCVCFLVSRRGTGRVERRPPSVRPSLQASPAVSERKPEKLIFAMSQWAACTMEASTIESDPTHTKTSPSCGSSPPPLFPTPPSSDNPGVNPTTPIVTQKRPPGLGSNPAERRSYSVREETSLNFEHVEAATSRLSLVDGMQGTNCRRYIEGTRRRRLTDEPAASAAAAENPKPGEDSYLSTFQFKGCVSCCHFSGLYHQRSRLHHLHRRPTPWCVARYASMYGR